MVAALPALDHDRYSHGVVPCIRPKLRRVASPEGLNRVDMQEGSLHEQNTTQHEKHSDGPRGHLDHGSSRSPEWREFLPPQGFAAVPHEGLGNYYGRPSQHR